MLSLLVKIRYFLKLKILMEKEISKKFRRRRNNLATFWKFITEKSVYRKIRPIHCDSRWMQTASISLQKNYRN
jgi:hypothetical protein